MDDDDNNEEQQDRATPTVEEIFSSVLQNKKTLLHGRLRKRPLREINKKSEENHKKEDLKNDDILNTKLSLLRGSSSQLSSIRECDKANIGSFSSSKMMRSVSTPEMNVKFQCYSTQKTKPAASRKVDFSSCQDSSLGAKVNKENIYDENLQEFMPELSKRPLLKPSLSNLKLKSSESTPNYNQKYSALLLGSKNSRRINSNVDKNSLTAIKRVLCSSTSSQYSKGADKDTSCSSIYSATSSCKEKTIAEHSTVRQSLLFNRDLSKPSFSRTSSCHTFSNLEKYKGESTGSTKDSLELTASTQDSQKSTKKITCPSFMSLLQTSQIKCIKKNPEPPTSSSSFHLENSDMLSVKGQNYLKLGILGKGGSSVVYKVLDMICKSVKAIKVVCLNGEDQSVLESYINEIKILERLQYSSRIIKLYSYEVSESELKIVMEAGGVDLATILSDSRKNKVSISPFTIQHYWQAMLMAVQDIHSEGIIHSDLKPANFILFNETLKLIDFGIASSIQQDMTSVFKDSQAGTFNYMSPESLRDIYSGPIINGEVSDKPTIKLGVKSDVWSLGCILYNLVYGRTPFQHITQPLLKLAAISNAKTKITFGPISEIIKDVLFKCLQFDPTKRPSIKELLAHRYLRGNLLQSPTDTVVSPSA